MKKLIPTYFFAILIFIFATFAGFVSWRTTVDDDKHFVLLAQSFIKNDLFLSPFNLPAGDYADYKARQYLFFGPLPSITLIPLVLVWGERFPQILLSFVSLIVTFIAIFLLVNKLRFTKVDSFWLANFFVFGTVLYFVGLVNISALVVQAVGTAILFLSLLEYFTFRRWFVIGLLVAAAGATRIQLFVVVLFFLLELWRNRNQLNFRREFFLLVIPVIICLSLLGLYNFRRFGSVFDTGYTRNVSELNKNYTNWNAGWFSPVHIPAKLYSILLAAPETVRRGDLEFVFKFPYLRASGTQGMALWITSPLFIYLLLAKKRPWTMSALLTLPFLILPALVYEGTGGVQYGFRYSLDFLPLLFLILLSAFGKKLPLFAKFLIAGGIIFNGFYMFSIWESYPLLSFWQNLK